MCFALHCTARKSRFYHLRLTITDLVLFALFLTLRVIAFHLIRFTPRALDGRIRMSALLGLGGNFFFFWTLCHRRQCAFGCSVQCRLLTELGVPGQTYHCDYGCSDVYWNSVVSYYRGLIITRTPRPSDMWQIFFLGFIEPEHFKAHNLLPPVVVYYRFPVLFVGSRAGHTIAENDRVDRCVRCCSSTSTSSRFLCIVVQHSEI